MTTCLTRNLLFVLLAVFSINGLAQSKPAAASSPDGTLTPVAWLVGGTWVTDVKDPSDGSTTHVENRIRWAPNHQAIEFNTNFNGKPHYNGFYAYDPAKKAINFFYTSESGQLTIGASAADADGKTVHQEFDVMQPDGKTQHIKSTLVRDGNDAYDFSVFMQNKAGDWAQVFKIRYERK